MCTAISSRHARTRRRRRTRIFCRVELIGLSPGCPAAFVMCERFFFVCVCVCVIAAHTWSFGMQSTQVCMLRCVRHRQCETSSARVSSASQCSFMQNYTLPQYAHAGTCRSSSDSSNSSSSIPFVQTCDFSRTMHTHARTHQSARTRPVRKKVFFVFLLCATSASIQTNVQMITFDQLAILRCRISNTR